MSLDVYLKCPCCDSVLFEANITHNLNEMAMEAGIYIPLWRPDEIPVSIAGELSGHITEGFELMKSDPERFKVFNAPNGWGTYDDFIPWIQEYLDALDKFPKAIIEVSR